MRTPIDLRVEFKMDSGLYPSNHKSYTNLSYYNSKYSNWLENKLSKELNCSVSRIREAFIIETFKKYAVKENHIYSTYYGEWLEDQLIKR